MNVVGSTGLYLGIGLLFVGLILMWRPWPRLRVPTRKRAFTVVAAGIGLVAVALLLPARESSVASPRTKLDEWMPAWQFSERHTLRIAAPPARALDAIRNVRADEIQLFRTLTWIRRGGRDQAPGILNAGDSAAILDVATRNGFLWLADDSVREMVVGTIISRPHPRALVPELFKQQLPPGFTLATMNFLVEPDGAGGSVVTTETRVHANSAAARRRFAAYWRLIYPGSALIRRMWLRAIAARST